MGRGPGTGKGLGPCGGKMGYGRRAGGGGFGFRRFFSTPLSDMSEEEEEETLSREAGFLEERLNNIKSRLGRLKGEK